MPTLLTENCIGCGACVEVCRPKTIKLIENSLGFYQAYAFEINCNGCGHCKTICPQLRSKKNPLPTEVVAYQNPCQDSLRKSQSGGAFSAIAEHILKQKGYVVGIQWNTSLTNIEYVIIDSIDKLSSLQGSKYIMPPNLVDLLPKLKRLLDRGDTVLFASLPCHVSAVKNIFRRYQNLILIDLLCYGPMAPALWKSWRSNALPRNAKNFYFRDKSRTSWLKAEPSTSLSDGDTLFYKKKPWVVRAFQKGSCQSLFCQHCKFRSLERVGDLSIGDFWGIQDLLSITPETLKQGISLVLVNSRTGKELLPVLTQGTLGYVHETSYKALKKSNGGFLQNNINLKSRRDFLKAVEFFGADFIVTLNILHDRLKNISPRK